MRFLLLASSVLAAAAGPPSTSLERNMIVSPLFPSCSGCGSNACGYTKNFVLNWESLGICIWDQGSRNPPRYDNNAVAPIAFTPPGGIATSFDVKEAYKKVTVSFSVRSSKNAGGCAQAYPNLTVKVSGGITDHSFDIGENTIAWVERRFTFRPQVSGIYVITFTTVAQPSIGCAPTVYNIHATQDY